MLNLINSIVARAQANRQRIVLPEVRKNVL